MTANQMCFFQKFNSYITTLLNHPSWFQNISFAIVGILFPIVVGLIIELEKERKVLDLRLIGLSIKPKLILFFVVLYFLVPLVFPVLIGLKYLAFFILCCWLIISICLFYFKLFTPLIGWIFSEEKRWNMRIEYLEKRKNELQKSKSKSQLIHEIAKEWNCVWSEKSIPYNKQKELFDLFLNTAKIVQDEDNYYGSVRKLFETIKQNLKQIPYNTIYHLYEFCLKECLCLYLTIEKANSVLDFLIELICEDIPCVLNDYDHVFACWNNFTKEGKEFIELKSADKRKKFLEITKKLLIEEIFFKNLNKFKTLPKIFKSNVCSNKIIETALIRALKDKLKMIVQNSWGKEKDAEILSLLFEKFLNVSNKVLFLWILEAFIWLNMNKERFWEVLNLFPILKDSKDKLHNMFQLTNEDKKLLEKLRYTNVSLDELLKRCKKYICEEYGTK